jgi:hypothetical protein
VADRTSNRAGWTGIVVPQALTVTVSDGDQAGGHVGPAVPESSNVGDLVVRTIRTERSSAIGEVTARVHQPGGISRGLPLEFAATGSTGNEMRWMEPVLSWGWERIDPTPGVVRVARWGGAHRWTEPLLSNETVFTTWANVAHDIAPAGDNEALIVKIVQRSAGWAIQSELWRENTGIVAARSQAVDPVRLPTTVDVRHVRVAWRDGEALLLATVRSPSGAQRDRIHQWASDDGGLTWTWVGSTSSYGSGISASVGDIVVSHEGLYVVAWASQDDDGDVWISRMATAWEPLWTSGYVATSSASAWNASTASMVQGLRLALMAEETGTLWMVLCTYEASANMEGVTYRSLDGGLSWTRTSSGSAVMRWSEWHTGVGRPDELDAVWLGLSGLVLLDVQSSLYGVRLGGWSHRGQGLAVWGEDTPLRYGPGGGAAYVGTVGWRLAWHPVGIAPVGSGWTPTGLATATTGSSSVSLSYGAGTRAGWRAERVLNSSTTSAHTVHRVGVRHVARCTALMVDHEAPVVLDVTCSDGTAKTYGVRVAIGTDTVRAYYRTGASTWSALGVAVANPHGSAQTEWYLVVEVDLAADSVACRIVGRVATSVSHAALDGWSDVLSRAGASPTNLWASVPQAELSWGGYVANGETSIHYGTECTNSFVGLDPAWPSELPGRALGPTSRMILPPDVMVEVVGGLAADSDEFTIGDAYDHAGQHLADPDPRREWRSPGRTAATITATHAAVVGPLYAVVIRGLTAEAVTAEVRDASTGTWSSVTLNRTITGLTAGRIGTEVLRPAAGSTTTPLLRRGEFDGAWVSYDGDALPVVRTHEGKWTASSSEKAGSFTVRGAASGGAGSGALVIYPSELVLLVYANTTVIDGVRFSLASGTLDWPTGTVWSARHLVAGPVVVLGDDSDWSRSVRVERAVDMGETPDGRLRPRARGPTRRVVDLSWTDGVDTSRAAQDGDDTDYIAHASGARAAGLVGATPWTLQGLYEQLRGGESDIVLLRRVPIGQLGTGALDTVTLRRQPLFVHGWVDQESLQNDVVLGEEDNDELIRGSSVTVFEIT